MTTAGMIRPSSFAVRAYEARMHASVPFFRLTTLFLTAEESCGIRGPSSPSAEVIAAANLYRSRVRMRLLLALLHTFGSMAMLFLEVRISFRIAGVTQKRCMSRLARVDKRALDNGIVVLEEALHLVVQSSRSVAVVTMRLLTDAISIPTQCITAVLLISRDVSQAARERNLNQQPHRHHQLGGSAPSKLETLSSFLLATTAGRCLFLLSTLLLTSVTHRQVFRGVVRCGSAAVNSTVTLAEAAGSLLGRRSSQPFGTNASPSAEDDDRHGPGRRRWARKGPAALFRYGAARGGVGSMIVSTKVWSLVTSALNWLATLGPEPAGDLRSSPTPSPLAHMGRFLSRFERSATAATTGTFRALAEQPQDGSSPSPHGVLGLELLALVTTDRYIRHAGHGRHILTVYSESSTDSDLCGVVDAVLPRITRCEDTEVGFDHDHQPSLPTAASLGLPPWLKRATRVLRRTGHLRQLDGIGESNGGGSPWQEEDEVLASTEEEASAAASRPPPQIRRAELERWMSVLGMLSASASLMATAAAHRSGDSTTGVGTAESTAHPLLAAVLDTIDAPLSGQIAIRQCVASLLLSGGVDERAARATRFSTWGATSVMDGVARESAEFYRAEAAAQLAIPHSLGGKCLVRRETLVALALRELTVLQSHLLRLRLADDEDTGAALSNTSVANSTTIASRSSDSLLMGQLPPNQTVSLDDEEKRLIAKLPSVAQVTDLVSLDNVSGTQFLALRTLGYDLIAADLSARRFISRESSQRVFRCIKTFSVAFSSSASHSDGFDPVIPPAVETVLSVEPPPAATKRSGFARTSSAAWPPTPLERVRHHGHAPPETDDNVAMRVLRQRAGIASRQARRTLLGVAADVVSWSLVRLMSTPAAFFRSITLVCVAAMWDTGSLNIFSRPSSIEPPPQAAVAASGLATTVWSYVPTLFAVTQLQSRYRAVATVLASPSRWHHTWDLFLRPMVQLQSLMDVVETNSTIDDVRNFLSSHIPFARQPPRLSFDPAAFTSRQDDLANNAHGIDGSDGEAHGKGLTSNKGARGIEFRSVTFSYHADAAISSPSLAEGTFTAGALNRFSAFFPFGTVTGVVGPSGGGKSTILKLLKRIYDPVGMAPPPFLTATGGEGGRRPGGGETRDHDDGTEREAMMLSPLAVGRTDGIFIGGLRLDQFDVGSLRRGIVWVPQHPVILPELTIAQNIAFGNRDVTLGDIEWAARVADIHGMIEQQPLGYETIVSGEDCFSGGERQRLALARALVLRPRILLLDEATSALDVLTEKRVLRSIFRALRPEDRERSAMAGVPPPSSDRRCEGTTVIMVAHRFASLRYADRIVVVGKGKCVEAGTREELLRVPEGERESGRAAYEADGGQGEARTLDELPCQTGWFRRAWSLQKLRPTAGGVDEDGIEHDDENEGEMQPQKPIAAAADAEGPSSGKDPLAIIERLKIAAALASAHPSSPSTKTGGGHPDAAAASTHHSKAVVDDNNSAMGSERPNGHEKDAAASHPSAVLPAVAVLLNSNACTTTDEAGTDESTTAAAVVMNRRLSLDDGRQGQLTDNAEPGGDDFQRLLGDIEQDVRRLVGSRREKEGSKGAPVTQHHKKETQQV